MQVQALGKQQQPSPEKQRSLASWQELIGAWADLPDSMLDDLDAIRHSNPPSPPIEEQLRDLDL